MPGWTALALCAACVTSIVFVGTISITACVVLCGVWGLVGIAFDLARCPRCDR